VRLVAVVAGAAFTSAWLLSGCGGGGATTTPPPGAAPDLVAKGAGLVQVKPCLVCHTTNGGSSAGPTFAGLAGSRVMLSDGTIVTADNAYLRRSIIDPGAQTVAGFPKGLMATLVPPNSITTLQAAAIVAYLDTLGVNQPAK
jgi:cytochrome c oxidase subunit II